jgi:hypothetical protein
VTDTPASEDSTKTSKSSGMFERVKALSTLRRTMPEAVDPLE